MRHKPKVLKHETFALRPDFSVFSAQGRAQYRPNLKGSEAKLILQAGLHKDTCGPIEVCLNSAWDLHRPADPTPSAMQILAPRRLPRNLTLNKP